MATLCLRPGLSLWLAGLLTACALQAPLSPPPPSETPYSETSTPNATPTPRLSPTRTPTRTPSPRPSATPTPCLETVTPAQLRTEPLEVTYISDGDLYQWREQDDITQQLTTHGEVQSFWVSPDRQVIAFVRGGQDYTYVGSEIWAVNRDGSNERRLASREFFAGIGTNPHPAYAGNGPARLRWRPGTHTLLFRVEAFINAVGGGATYFPGVWAVDADTLKRQKLPDSADPWVDNVALYHLASPDGKRMAIVTSGNISITDIEGRGRRNILLTYPPLGLGEILGTPQVRWTPDSRALRVVLWGTDPTGQLAREDAITTWLVPVDGSPPQQLAHLVGNVLGVSLSPDQQRLAYRRYNGWAVFLARFDGAAERIYDAVPSLSFYGWAPDSARFAYGGYQLPARLGHICGPHPH
ncbi:MAG: hypothetical protein NZM11_05735 [Anaerolineales bacterium]|nr:hypothetical protein [Anaerolineales bacterium]